MTRQRLYQTEAIIIKKTKLGEADCILTFCTPHLGKIQGFAKSLRKPKSKMAGHLELLTHSMVSFARGKNIDMVVGAQTIDSFLPLKSDLDLSSRALYVIELVAQFSADNQENYTIFRLLLDTLDRLVRENDKELVMRSFEMRLLEAAGYRPQLQHCLSCHTALQPVPNAFCATAGGMMCPECARTQPLAYPLSVNAQKVLRLLQADDFSIISRLKLPPELAVELESVIRNYLRYLLERDLKSVAWLDTLKHI